MMNGWDMTGWGWGWMTIWTVIAIVLIVLFASAVLRASSPSTKFPGSADSAMAVLRRRYAAGEIDEAEFNRRRAELEDTREERTA